MQYLQKILTILLFTLLVNIGQKVQAQYPAIPGNPTSFQNTNTPDPFLGTFYNGGNPVFVLGTYTYNSYAYCIDRSVPVCDGTKNPLTPGPTNTNNQLAYALYLLSKQSYPDAVRRELIWALTGQPNNCNANSACAALLAQVQQLNPSTPLTLSVTTTKTQYSLSEKVIFQVNTNVDEVKIIGQNMTATNVTFCDASGNTVTPAGASIVASGNYATINYPITNRNTPQTYYVCFDPPKTLRNYCFSFEVVPGASDVSVWEKPGCQTLVYLMSPNYQSIPQFTVGSCADLPLTKKPSAHKTYQYGGGYQSNEQYDYLEGDYVKLITHFYEESTGNGGNDDCSAYSSASTYTWAGPNSFTSNLKDPVISNVVAASSGVYSVTAIISYNNFNCTATCTVSIKVCPSTGADLVATPSSAAGINGNGTNQFSIAAGSNIILSSAIPSGSTNIALALYQGGAPNYNAGGNNIASSLPFNINNFGSTNVGQYRLNYQTSAGCSISVGITLILGAAPQANISLQKTVSKANPSAGESIIYSIKITNAGPQVATNVILKDTLPAGLTFVSVSTGVGTYNTGTGLWTIGTIPVGTTIVTMTVTVN